MSDDFTIRKCSPQDVQAIQTYIDQYWRKGHILARDRDFLEWQFSAPGDEKNPQILLLLKGDQIMGMRGLIPHAFNVLGRQLPGTWTGNLHCRQEVRNGVVSLRLMRSAHSLGFAFIAVIGANNRTTRIYKALRYHMIDSIPRVVGVTNRRATLELLRQGQREDVSEQRLREQCDRHLVSHDIITQSAADRCVPWERRWHGVWDTFWRTTASKNLICTDRDSSYLNRRYHEHRWFRYGMHISLHPRDETATGLLVYRVEKVKDSAQYVLRVTELLAFEDGAFRALIGKLLDVSAECGAAFCDFFCTMPSLLDSLSRYGLARCQDGEGTSIFPSRFQPLDFKQTRFAGAFRPSKDLLATLAPTWLSHLYVTKSDGDQDRPV